jgi:hypothetical protein
MKKKNLKTGKRAPELKRGKPVRVQRLVRQIADELLTVNYGHPSAETGDRLAIKKADGQTERDLGGRCRQSIEMVLRRHLSNSRQT